MLAFHNATRLSARDYPGTVTRSQPFTIQSRMPITPFPTMAGCWFLVAKMVCSQRQEYLAIPISACL